MEFVEESSEAPEWMVVLEKKRNRHHKLAHEIGAGAPCLNCKEDCSGLDLHFWRKLCKSCKCKKEAHDIKDEDSYEQFEILFGESISKSRDHLKEFSVDLAQKLKNGPLGNTLLDVTSKKNGITFDWVPLNVPLQLASEYMQQLPLEKLPIAGTEGAVFRRQQLQKQIPLYDFDINKCHELSAEEVEAFTGYVQNLKDAVVGQGCVTKVPVGPELTQSGNYISPSDGVLGVPTKNVLPSFKNLNISPKPFRPFNADKVGKEHFESNSADVPSVSSSAKELKTPSAFFGKPGIFPPVRPHLQKNDSEHPEENTGSSKESPVKNGIVSGEHNLRPSFLREIQQNAKEPKPELISGTKLKENVEPQNENYGINQPMPDIIADRTPRSSPFMPRVPFNTPTTPSMTQTGPALSPKIERNRPKVTFGSATVMNQIENELPYDGVLISDTLLLCHHCGNELGPGEVAVRAERAGVGLIWHPKCFVCHSCKELLVDLVYFFYKGDVYCGRHYAEVVNIPRCFACDELIFLKEYTVAEGQTFHVKHFCCFECDTPLAGMQYVPKDGNPVCLSCYNLKYGKECQSCKKIIGASDSRLGWKHLNWHATPSCFKCFECSKCLLGEKFVVKNDQHPLCSQECVRIYKLRYV